MAILSFSHIFTGSSVFRRCCLSLRLFWKIRHFVHLVLTKNSGLLDQVLVDGVHNCLDHPPTWSKKYFLLFCSGPGPLGPGPFGNFSGLNFAKMYPKMQFPNPWVSIFLGAICLKCFLKCFPKHVFWSPWTFFTGPWAPGLSFGPMGPLYGGVWAPLFTVTGSDGWLYKIPRLICQRELGSCWRPPLTMR